MGSWFLNAGFLGMGTAALISAPVIIHLINRYRFRRVEFAAMEFLLSSQKRNRRKILIEQLLLLLAVVVVVVCCWCCGCLLFLTIYFENCFGNSIRVSKGENLCLKAIR